MLCPRGVPPVLGGAERLWTAVVAQLTARGHDAHVVAVDSPEATLAEVVHSYARFDALTLDDFDLVITGKYPAWMVRHHRHVVHLCHPLRGLYDSYVGPQHPDRTELSDRGRRVLDLVERLEPGAGGARDRVLEAAVHLVDHGASDRPDLRFPGPLARVLVQWLDRDALHPAHTTRWSAISRTVAQRPNYFPPDVQVGVLMPPSGLRGLEPTPPGMGFFTASRLDAPKRIDLLIDAVAAIADPTVRLRVAGTGAQQERLRAMAATDSRVELLGALTDAELVAEYARCRAVLFVPHDEDLGLIAYEAHAAGRAVVTCDDSGGVTEVVRDGVNGLVVPASPAALAGAIGRLHDDVDLAATLGARGARDADAITWDRVIGGLLAPPTPAPALVRRARPRVVALSTYQAWPARHGGQVRIRHLLEALSATSDVELYCLGDREEEELLAPGFVQRTYQPGGRYYAADQRFTDAVGAPTGDIVASLHADDLGGLDGAARRAASTADAVVVCQPYLGVLAPEERVVIYDSHNVEAELKAAMYRPTPAGVALADAVRAIEADLVARSRLVTAVSLEDVDALRALAPTMAAFELVPNGCAVDALPFVAGARRRRRGERYLAALRRFADIEASALAVFLGSGHPPNLAAAALVLTAAEALPGVAFVMAGSHAARLPADGRPANVIARGPVSASELRLLLTSCDVALNPMISGSGTNIKMLDYFAAGAPVVATAVGARGLDAEPGQHYRLTDGADLAQVIRNTLADPHAAAGQVIAARRIADSMSWWAVAADFRRAVERTLH